MVPLGSVVNVSETTGPDSALRYNGFRAAAGSEVLFKMRSAKARTRQPSPQTHRPFARGAPFRSDEV